MKAKKLLALLMALAMLATLAACGESEKAESPSTSANPSASTSTSETPAGTSSTPGGTESTAPGSEAPPAASTRDTLNVAAMQDSGTLHPLGITGGFVGINYTFYEPLFDYNPDGSRIWILATGMDYVSDINYTLHIREGIKFSNGKPMTAEDVMFSMELCKDNPQFSLNVKVVDFEKTKVTGEYTIDLWYTVFNASQEPGMTQLMIMCKDGYDELALSLEPIGTGPYVVDEYVVNSHLYLKAREDYWGGAPAIKNLNFKVINEEAQRVNALQTHDIDMSAIPLKDVDFIKSLGYDVVTSNGGYNFVTLFSCLEDAPLGSKEARWAVCHAIDRQTIADILYYGMSEVTNWPCSNFCVDYEPRFENMHDTYTIGYDIAKAKELAEQSGLVGKTLRIITNGSSDHVTAAEIIQSGLNQIGVKVEILNYDQATYFPMMMDASNFEIAMFTPGAPSAMAIDILAMYLTFIPLGWTGPIRDLYGEVSMGAISTVDLKQRNDKLYETVEIFVENCPWYGICEVMSARARASDLRGAEGSLAGIVYYQDAYFVQ